MQKSMPTISPALQNKLRDPIWQFVIGILALALTFVGTWRALNTKALSVEVVSETPLLTVQDEAAGRLQIAFEGKPVQDVILSIIKVSNTGDVPILVTDFQRPLTLSFGQNAEVLSAEVVEMTPPNIGASAKAVSNIVELSPVLLNSGDTATLKILLTKYENNVTVDARIVGVGQVVLNTIKSPTMWHYLIYFIGVIGLAIVTLFNVVRMLEYFRSSRMMFACLMILIFMFVLVVLGWTIFFEHVFSVVLPVDQ